MYSWSLFFFFLFEMSLCHHCFKDSFAGYDIFFFFFVALIFCPLPLAFIAVICFIVLLYMMSYFSLASFKSLSFNRLAVMCLCIDLFLFISLGFIELLGSANCFPSYVRSFQPLLFQIFFLCPFLSFPSGIPITHKSVNLMLSHRSLRLCSFLSFFSLFYLLKSTT